jgi:hypothetical protein
MNMMMLKMIADFIGIEPDDIKSMVFDGQAAIGEGLRYMQKIDHRLDLIMAHLGIDDTAPPVTIENGEIVE